MHTCAITLPKINPVSTYFDNVSPNILDPHNLRELDTYNLVRKCRPNLPNKPTKRLLPTHTAPPRRKRQRKVPATTPAFTPIPAVKPDIIDTKVTQEQHEGKLPTYAQCILRHKHGRPSRAYQFSGEVVFDHILLILYTSSYVDREGIESLCTTHPLFKHLLNVYDCSKRLPSRTLGRHGLDSMHNHRFRPSEFVYYEI